MPAVRKKQHINMGEGVGQNGDGGEPNTHGRSVAAAKVFSTSTKHIRLENQPEVPPQSEAPLMLFMRKTYVFFSPFCQGQVI